MTAQELITSIRRYIGQLAMPYESIRTDREVYGSTTTTFSDDDLLARITVAIQDIIRRCKAIDFPNLILRHSGTYLNAKSLSERIFQGRVERHDGTKYVNALRIDPMEYRSMVMSGRTPTAEYPVYTYRDGDIKIYPTPDTGSSSFRFFSVSNTTEILSLETVIPLDERFRRAMVLHVAASCYATMKKMEESNYIMSLFEDEIYPYRIDIIYNPMDGIESRSE